LLLIYSQILLGQTVGLTTPTLHKKSNRKRESAKSDDSRTIKKTFKEHAGNRHLTIDKFNKFYLQESIDDRQDKKDSVNALLSEYREKYLILDNVKLSTDSIKSQEQDIVDSIANLVKSENDDTTAEGGSGSCCKVKIFGAGAASSSIASLSSATGNLSIGVAFSFGKDTTNTIYGMYNAHAANSTDSNVISKTFLFPEIGKRLFTLGYMRDFVINKKDCIHIVPFTEFSENKLTDSASQTIYTFSSTLGVRFDWHSDSVNFGNSKIPVIFSVFPYYNLISVDSKYYTDNNNEYNTMFNESHLPPTFHTVGFEAILSISTFQIFADLKWVLNNKDLGANDTNLRGNSIVIGTIVNADFLNF